MKLIITALIAIATMGLFAQSAKFNDAMTKAISEMDSAKTAEQFLTVANKFERIALAEKNQWLPYYYSALSRVTATYISENQTETDAILDVAQKHINMADSLMPGNSEIILTKAMVLSGRIMVDPMTRGMQYGMQSGMLMEESRKLDPENPRVYLMMGQSLFYTPEQFGGGKDKGCAQMLIAQQKFETFQPANELHPDWGEEMTKESLKQCN